MKQALTPVWLLEPELKDTTHSEKVIFFYLPCHVNMKWKFIDFKWRQDVRKVR